MAAKKVWFNWHCPHCQHRHRVHFPFQFEMPNHYSAVWECEECGKESKLEWDFAVHGWFQRKKPPKLRKRKREKKERKKEEAVGTIKDRAYRNDHGSHR